MDTHRELHPQQYSHALVGKTVRATFTDSIKPFVVQRVLPSMFGELIKPPHSDVAFSIHKFEVIG